MDVGWPSHASRRRPLKGRTPVRATALRWQIAEACRLARRGVSLRKGVTNANPRRERVDRQAGQGRACPNPAGPLRSSRTAVVFSRSGRRLIGVVAMPRGVPSLRAHPRGTLRRPAGVLLFPPRARRLGVRPRCRRDVLRSVRLVWSHRRVWTRIQRIFTDSTDRSTGTSPSSRRA